LQARDSGGEVAAMDSAEQAAMIQSLKQQLEVEKRKNASLEEANRALKRQMGVQQSQIEAEEELITNKLMARIEEIEKERRAWQKKVEEEEGKQKRERSVMEAKLQESSNHLDRLKHEKECLAQQVEQEEEFLTNTLQNKLRKVLMEKVDLENRLEQEQEYISNKLQKQVSDTSKEKKTLERMLEEEKERVASMEEQKKQLADQLQQLKLSVEFEQEYISNKLGKTLEMMVHEKAELQHKLEEQQQHVVSLSKECEQQRSELRKFQGASYVMQQRIIRESKRLKDMTRANGRLAETFEMELERQLNSVMNLQLGVAIDQTPPRPHYVHDSSLPAGNEMREDEFDYPADANGDVVGELMRSDSVEKTYGSLRRGETQSLPNFSPRQSPYPTPPATPFSSRSHSPINASPTSSRSQSPMSAALSQSSMSSAETRSGNYRNMMGSKARSAGIASPSSSLRGSSFVPLNKDPPPPRRTSLDKAVERARS